MAGLTKQNDEGAVMSVVQYNFLIDKINKSIGVGGKRRKVLVSL